MANCFVIFKSAGELRNTEMTLSILGDDAFTEFPGHTQKCVLCLLTILLSAIASNLHFVVTFITAIYFF